MKDPEEYFDKIPYDFRIPNAKEWICEQILNAQKDAYNQAIEDSLKNLPTKHELVINSILKLKIK